MIHCFLFELIYEKWILAIGMYVRQVHFAIIHFVEEKIAVLYCVRNQYDKKYCGHDFQKLRHGRFLKMLRPLETLLVLLQ